MAQAVSTDAGIPQPVAKIYFSDFFQVDPGRLEEYGAFNVSLVNDLPLFVDPFLLFDSGSPEYTALHNEIIRYVRFLRDAAVSGTLTEGHFTHWFFFPEVSQNWLGFSRTGNKGSGLGRIFATALRRNLLTMFSDFGKETVSRGSHLEKLCLVADGVGRDHLSDFATNLIQHYLLEYTERFAAEHIRPEFIGRFAIDKVAFDYATGRWQRRHFNLPAFSGDYVLLTPKDILTKDEAWINRSELLDRFPDIYNSVPNEQLRAQINDFFVRALATDPNEEERRQAAAASVERFPEVLDYYIRQKEDRGDEAHSDSKRKVADTEVQFIVQINQLVS